ncbi:MAG TPA: hypothetical protein VH475_20750 [Tepidisphaeraceae bacterium]
MQGAPNSRQFGLVIAYVVPGFIALAGLAPLFPAVAHWLRPVAATGDGFGLGPPLYAVLGAMALGSVLSCFRWVLIDHVHHWTGIERPAWDDRQLEQVLGGFDYLVQAHFRYYEFCGNTLLALSFAYGVNRYFGTLPFLGPGTDLTVLVVIIVLFAASRDALAKYYTRTGLLVGRLADREFGDHLMQTYEYNGNDHGGSSDKPKAKPKPQQRPKVPSETKPAEGKSPHDRR